MPGRSGDRPLQGHRQGAGVGSAKFNVKAFRTGSAKLKTKRRGTVKVTVRSVTRGHASTTKATVKLR